MTALPRLARVLAAAACSALLAAGLASPAFADAPAATRPSAASSHDHSPEYYVSLGDSLAAGYQPNVGHNTDVSYTDQLYAQLKQHDPDLVHVKLGCSGETTETMIDGGICSYPGATSQLDAAVKFLRAHRGHVSYLTLDIGANDVDGCLKGGAVDLNCALQGIATVTAQVPQITAALHRAGGSHPRYAAMNYYDPFLAVWLTGPAGQQAAQESAQLSVALNGAIALGLKAGEFRLADVSTAFSTLDFTDQATLPGVGQVPLNVARICTWTWMCTPYQDIHATPTGHAVIAGVFRELFRHHRR
ncbi:SGNH/GDSL hydrolase family protein [Streptacidiphilus pinicola]|uniref:SGNH/GDSL hydrolase family protein n=1 Tax=Streptacidiphilus pinicola TaxID=2219663 RepID=A0A2X0K7L3_9ACTN|nr:SGNH/GDSL hydrolase family protein [Streptacidiphilus pinicola]RAG85265.1 SGNH/GDSL hydrolase family protein [Streptacidiphilus pinicola]